MAQIHEAVSIFQFHSRHCYIITFYSFRMRMLPKRRCHINLKSHSLADLGGMESDRSLVRSATKAHLLLLDLRAASMPERKTSESLSNEQILLRRTCFLCLIMSLLQKLHPKVTFPLLVIAIDLTSFDFLELIQRRRLVLGPRSKPIEGQENASTTAEAEGSPGEEAVMGF